MMTRATQAQNETRSEQSVSDRFELFALLPEELRRRLDEGAMTRHFAAGETVYTIGQNEGVDLYLILSGKARLTTMSENGGGMSVESLGENDMLGLEWAMGDFRAEAMKTGLAAETDLDIVLAETDIVRQAVRKSPKFARQVLEYFAARLLSEKSENANGTDEVRSRIYDILLGLVERHPDNPEIWHIPVMPKHRELSEQAGASEQEAAEIVAGLISSGAVRRNYPGLIIEDYARLKSIAHLG